MEPYEHRGAEPFYPSGRMRKVATLPLPIELHDGANAAAERAGLSRSQWIRRAMERAMKAENTKAARDQSRGNRPADSHPPGEEPDGI